MNLLEEKFKDKGIVQPNGLWIIFPKNIAIEFVKECEQESYEILGIDAFFVEKDHIQPSLRNSINFCNSDYPEYHVADRYKYASNFLINSNDNMYFEVACEKR